MLIYLGKLFQTVGSDRCKYLQGTLFALGGLLKLEAKSYLYTITEQWQSSDASKEGVP